MPCRTVCNLLRCVAPTGSREQAESCLPLLLDLAGRRYNVVNVLARRCVCLKDRLPANHRAVGRPAVQRMARITSVR